MPSTIGIQMGKVGLHSHIPSSLSKQTCAQSRINRDKGEKEEYE